MINEYHILSFRMPFKRCFAPGCTNRSDNCDKIFITVPKDETIRKKWCEALNRKTVPKPTSGRIYCCEDHFDVNKLIIYS